MVIPARQLSFDRELSEASRILGVTLRRRTSSKAVGPCPLCGGDDRFVVWLFEGSAWCSRCGHKAYTKSMDEAAQLQAKAKVDKAEKQKELRAIMARCSDWVTYRDVALSDPELVELWNAEGIGLDEIKRWSLGYCGSCPVFPRYPSLSIPVFFGGALVDIRHKILKNGVDADEDAPRYTSHMAGLAAYPFNLDAAEMDGSLLVVEGEKKAIISDSAGFGPVTGIPGYGNVFNLLASLSRHKGKKVVVALDPGVESQAEKLAAEIVALGLNVFIADFFAKPDDVILNYGREIFSSILKQSRRVG